MVMTSVAGCPTRAGFGLMAAVILSPPAPASLKSTVLWSVAARKNTCTSDWARSGDLNARTRYEPPRIDGSCQDPPPVVVTSWKATDLPTRRSTWTVAPSTGPCGPDTVPPREASPGPTLRATVVVVRATVLLVVVGFTVDVVVGGNVVSVAGVVGGAAACLLLVQATARQTRKTYSRSARGTP